MYRWNSKLIAAAEPRSDNRGKHRGWTGLPKTQSPRDRGPYARRALTGKRRLKSTIAFGQAMTTAELPSPALDS
ncbi:MAG TPA: hypothetical protein DDW52_11925 [Planctomycetaceae bacterium]|nr:hypothetical protein [Planctomycetaceae bacterium]